MKRHDKFPGTPIRRRILFGVVVLLLIAILGYFWRSNAVPGYVSLFFSHGIDSNFDKDFSTLNSRLDAYDVHFPDHKTSCYNHVTDGGQNGYYHHFSETVPCVRLEISNPVKQPENTIAHLKQLLKTGGWQTQDFQPLIHAQNPRYAGRSDSYSIEPVFGYKLHGKTYCQIGLEYPAVYGTRVVEACERDVSFFGGSDG